MLLCVSCLVLLSGLKSLTVSNTYGTSCFLRFVFINICCSFSESLSYPRRYPLSTSVLLEETEDSSSMRYESIMKEMDYHKRPYTATNMDRLNALKVSRKRPSSI